MSPSLHHPCDRAREGAILGAALLGAGGLALRLALRRHGQGGGHRLGHATEVAALMALAGAVAGALIGGAIESDLDEPGEVDWASVAR
jgi:hypothetical protein